MVFNCIVNFGLARAEMVSVGYYNYTDNFILAEKCAWDSYYSFVGDYDTGRRLLAKENGSMETAFELVHFDRNIGSREAVEEMAKQGMRPANMAELLAFGSQHPWEQLKYPIVGLGTVLEIPSEGHGRYRRDGCNCAVYLTGEIKWDGPRRHLLRCSWYDEWHLNIRFLAVREK